MEMTIMYAALMFVAGWFYFYICLRQFIFDLAVAYPLNSKLGAAGEEVFGKKGANRLNTISVVIWLLICGAIAWVVLRFCKSLWLLLPFWAGVLAGLACFAKKLGPRTRSNLEAWMRTYCRFMPDDELRMACYNADLPKVRAALRALKCDVIFDINK